MRLSPVGSASYLGKYKFVAITTYRWEFDFASPRMDPLSITVAALSLVTGIKTLLVSIHDFTSKFRDAQSDLNLVKNELESIQYALKFFDG